MQEAIGLCGFMRPGGAVLEVAYPLRKWPAVFMPVALGAQLRYYLSFGEKGKHSGPITADTNEVSNLAVKAAKQMGRWGVQPDPNFKPGRAPALASYCRKSGNQKQDEKKS